MNHDHSKDHLDKHDHPQPVKAIIEGAPEPIRSFLNGFLRSLYCTICDMQRSADNLEAQVAKLTKERNELLGIATCISADKAEAEATPEARQSAAAAVTAIIATHGRRRHATHRPTGKRCTIVIEEADRMFCDFGSKAEPFTWVKRTELTIDSGAA